MNATRRPNIFARIIEQHRDNPQGEVFRQWWVCSLCRVSVHPADKYCRSCGAELVNGGSYGT